MLAVSWDTVRLFLHVLAATIRSCTPAAAVLGALTGLSAGRAVLGVLLAG